MSAIVAILGAIVIVVFLIGFFRSLWRPSPRRSGNAGYGSIMGETPDSGGHGIDGGGGHGADGGSH
jgi:predicted permease